MIVLKSNKSNYQTRKQGKENGKDPLPHLNQTLPNVSIKGDNGKDRTWWNATDGSHCYPLPGLGVTDDDSYFGGGIPGISQAVESLPLIRCWTPVISGGSLAYFPCYLTQE